LTDLHGVVEYLMFVLLDVNNVLEHVAELLFAQDGFGRRRLALL